MYLTDCAALLLVNVSVQNQMIAVTICFDLSVNSAKVCQRFHLNSFNKLTRATIAVEDVDLY